VSGFFSLESWRIFWQHAFERIVSHGFLIAGILLGYVIARAVIFRIIDGAMVRLIARHSGTSDSEERANRLKTLNGIVRSFAGYVLIFVLIIMLMDAVGANITGIITTAGIGAVAIGIGAQKLVRDVIAGFFFIMEDQFTVGEYVTIGGAAGTIAGSGATGVVDSIGMRITRLRDDQGRLWTLANSDISAVVNHSRAPVESFIEIGLAPATDVKQAEAAINAAGEEVFSAAAKGRLSQAPKAVGVSGWDTARTTIRVSLVADPRVAAIEQIRLREAILERFKEVDIAVA
jgi:small conductance mechanosensitive channel